MSTGWPYPKGARFKLGICTALCGQPGHAENTKPHVRNDACWNWRPCPETGDITLETIQTAYAADSLMGQAVASNAKPENVEPLTYEKLEAFYRTIQADFPSFPKRRRWFDFPRVQLDIKPL